MNVKGTRCGSGSSVQVLLFFSSVFEDRISLSPGWPQVSQYAVVAEGDLELATSCLRCG